MRIRQAHFPSFYWIMVSVVITGPLVSGCAAPAGIPTGTPILSSPSSSPIPSTATATSGVGEKLVIYAPATPSSVPVLLVAQRMLLNAAGGEKIEVSIFTDQSKASTLFLRGDVTMLVTGLSVGVEFFKNGAPVQMVNSYVAGLTYLVTYGKKVNSFSELKGQEIYIPFEGSPIEEITRFFVEQEDLTWKRDIKPIYSPFPSSVELLKQGKAAAVALPEPYVSLVEKQDRVYISLNYKEKWDALTGSANGYPQVGTFVKQDWAAAHPDLIAQFNTELVNALQFIHQDPAAAVEQTKADFSFPPQVLLASLQRTDFSFTKSDAMVQEIQRYYQRIGKPLNGKTFAPFFYRDQK